METESQHWPELLAAIIKELKKGCRNLTLHEIEEGVLLCSKLLSKLTPSTNIAREGSVSWSLGSPALSPTSSEFDEGDSIEYDSKLFEDSSGHTSFSGYDPFPGDNLKSRDGLTIDARDDVISSDGQESGSREQGRGSRDSECESRDFEQKARDVDQKSQDDDDLDRSNAADLSIESSALVTGKEVQTPELDKAVKVKNSNERKIDVEEVIHKEAKHDDEVEGSRKKQRIKGSRDPKTTEKSDRQRKDRLKERQRSKDKDSKKKNERPKVSFEETNSVDLVQGSQSMLIRRCIEHFMVFILEFFKCKIFHSEKALDLLKNETFTDVKSIPRQRDGPRDSNMHCAFSSPSSAAKTYSAMCKLLVELSCFPMQDKASDVPTQKG